MHTNEPVAGPVFAEGLPIDAGLTGAKVVFSGVDAPTFNYMKSRLTLHNAETLRRVSKKMTMLVIGPDAEDKHIAAAKEQGVPIVTQAELIGRFAPLILDGISGEAAPEELIEVVRRRAWWELKPSDSERLVGILRRHEEVHGVTEVHRFCSDWLIANDLLRVMTPFVHPQAITSYDLSPDRRWLLTASFTDEGADRVVAQIWDARSGALIQQLRVRFSVGWSDRNGARWSPDSRLVALSHNTNAVGVWEPFGGRMVTYASVTDGWPEPPGFAWSTDGAFVYIACPNQYKPEGKAHIDTAGMGSWMPARHTSADATGASEVGPMTLRPLADPLPWSAREGGQVIETLDGSVLLAGRLLVFRGSDGDERRRYDFAAGGLGGPQACLVGSFAWPAAWLREA